MTQILRLQAENVKRLYAVEIRPEDGGLVVIGGKNDAGKTSVLDSIAYALGGKKLLPEQPLRKGAKKGEVTVELDDGLLVTRTFTKEGGGNLTVRQRDDDGKKGPPLTSPQRILDKLVGSLTFDPLAFVEQDGPDQLKTLRALVGVDVSDLDEAIEAKKADYTTENAAYRQASTTLETLPEMHEGVPEEESSLQEILAEAEAAQQAAQRAEEAAEAVTEAAGVVDRQAALMASIEEQISQLQGQLTTAREARDEWREKIDPLQGEAEALVAAVPDLDAIRARGAALQETNQKVRENAARREWQAKLAEAETARAAVVKSAEALKEQKEKRIAGATFPVEGLSFGDDGVLYEGIPFEQAGAATRMRVSMAMALAMNPTLKVALIRDASLLDDDNLALVAKMAEEAEAQVWIERVGEGEEVSVVIEEGRVKSAREAS